MRIDFAPLEGITGPAYRRLHHEFFPGVDRYYTPFLSPTSDHRFTPREFREIDPDYNRDLAIVPQLLTKHADDFLWAVDELHAMGYEEVNLNFGCPSGTVTAKGKGSGMLSDLTALRSFLDKIYEKAPCKISIKTRLGLEAPEEFDRLLDLYNQYPVSELIVHPRIRKDFYRHPVRKACFEKAYQNAAMPITYNGSIITEQNYADCVRRWPNLHSVMIGQGLIADPALACKLRFQKSFDKAYLKEFHDKLLESYTQLFQSKNNAVKRMKEFWFYLICSFDDSDKLKKQLLKSKNADEYDIVVSKIFSQLTLLDHSTGNW